MPQRKPLGKGPGMRGRSDVINSSEQTSKCAANSVFRP